MLIKCPECGKEISDKATSCPNCGYPIQDYVKKIKNSKSNEDIKTPTKIRLEGKRLEDILEKANSEYHIPSQELGYEVISKRPYVVDIWRDTDSEPVQIIKSNFPKCPTCSSTNIQKISTSSKAAGAMTFGLFSKTAKSQFKCNNCGYKW